MAQQECPYDMILFMPLFLFLCVTLMMCVYILHDHNAMRELNELFIPAWLAYPIYSGLGYI